jgi:hypothetical protein
LRKINPPRIERIEEVHGFVSFYKQLRLILFTYWSSPLLSNKIFIISDSDLAFDHGHSHGHGHGRGHAVTVSVSVTVMSGYQNVVAWRSLSNKFDTAKVAMPDRDRDCDCDCDCDFDRDRDRDCDRERDRDRDREILLHKDYKPPNTLSDS